MNKFGYHNVNVRPVSSVYVHDSDVTINDTNIYTREGLDFVFTDGLSGLEDTTTNNFNCLFLTKTTPVNTILKIDKTVSTYPYYRTTWIKAADEDRFWVVDLNSGTTSMSGTSAALQRSYIFELEFINPVNVAVRHYNNDTLKFLTLNQANSAAMAFESRTVGASLGSDTQIFDYILDEDTDTITLVQRLSTIPGPGGSPTYPFIVTGLTNDTLSAGPLTNAATPYSGANIVNQFKLRDLQTASTAYDLNDTYKGYLSGVDHNSLLTDESRQVSNLENNFVVHSAVNDLNLSASRMDVNLFPMKNQVTLEGSTSRNNPYSNEETEVTHREYHKLHTGTYQKYGNDSIYTTFTTGTKEINFPSDQLTYFHMPQILTPYAQLNVNDSTLAKSGAIAGDSPANADKIFKKRSDIAKFNTPVDELNGSFLCAWLSGAGNSKNPPVWVDRYFNPSYSSRVVALTSGLLEPIPYIDTHESLTRHLGASAGRMNVYDKLSDIVFEPGILYAYHHVGRGNAQKVIDALQGHILAADLPTFKNFNGTHILPAFDTQESVHLDVNGDVATGPAPNSRSIEVPLLYEFDRDNYGITDVIKSTGSFTLNFWLFANDWGAPFGNQIVGNRITKGFGIFNETFVTPFIAVPDQNKVHIYNSDVKYLATHFLKKNIVLFTKKGCSENYWIVDDNNDVYEFDINGVVQDKIVSTDLTGKELVDIEISNRYLYILVRPNTGENAEYFRYDFTRARESGYTGELLNAAIWNFRSGPGATSTDNLSTCKIHAVYTGLSSSNGIIVTQQDALSSNSTDHNLLSGTYIFANGSTVDNLGKPWALQNGEIYTFNATTSANIRALSATQIVEGINIDRANNLWVLHDFNKVSKLDNDRNLLFTSTLSSLLPVSAARYNRSIDYITEFGLNGYISNPVVLVQSVSGSRIIKLDTNTGTTVTETSLLTGEDLPVQTFLTSPSAHKTYTGHDFIRKNTLNNVPRLEARIELTDLYNTSTTTQTYSSFVLTQTISGLSRGWHNFTVVLDAERGEYKMYNDSVLVDYISLSGAKYSYSDVFESPLIVGASPFYTKLLLSEHLQQPQHYLANGIKIKNLKLYDKPLRYYEIKEHFQLLQDTTTVKWDIPVGQRNYIDTIERVFKHSIPGRKSQLVNINVKNTQITDPALINDIKAEVTSKIESELPVHCKINELGWDSKFTTLTGTVIGNSITLAAPQTQSSSTTPSSTTGTTTNDY